MDETDRPAGTPPVPPKHSEQGIEVVPAVDKLYFGNCQGWTQMLCALKGYLEYGINLREGMFV